MLPTRWVAYNSWYHRVSTSRSLDKVHVGLQARNYLERTYLSRKAEQADSLQRKYMHSA
jgi:hypothetical protein